MNDIDPARSSLRGLALGDAFGETWFFRPAGQMDWLLAERLVAAGPWRWTDDTAMALEVYRMLADHGEIRPDDLASRFARTYQVDPHRGYGPAMHDVLASIGEGEPWASAAGRQFGGAGSWGNGAAMRIAPLGAYFADDLDRVVRQARLSATVTHAHPEAAAGAVAVALAAAHAVRGTPAVDVLPAVADATPDGEVRSRLRVVVGIPFSASPRSVAARVGCGARVSAPDTVPYALWCAARHLDDLVETLWSTVSAGGDMDTTCAIAGGVVAGRTGLDAVPTDWHSACEPLPDWANA